MFYFNLKQTGIYQAVEYSKVFGFIKIFKKIFFILFIFTFLLFLYGFLSEAFSLEVNSALLGLFIIFLTLSASFWLKLAFFNSKLKNPKLKVFIKEALDRPGKFNLAEFLSFEAVRAVDKSICFAESKKLPEINSSILLYFFLKDNSKLNFVFPRAFLRLKEIKEILEAHFKSYQTQPRNGADSRSVEYSKDFQDAILESLKIAQKKGHQRIEIGDMITALAKHDLVFKKILIDFKLKVEDIENLFWWLESLEKKIEKRKKWWEYRNLMRKGTLAKEWTAGYTLTLDQYGVDWTEIVKKQGFPEIIGHKKEIEMAERILSRQEINNVLLVGEAGTGRKSIICALATKSLLGESLPEINYKRIVELDLSSLISQIGNPEEIGAILENIFEEVILAGNVILMINHLQNFVGVKMGPGMIDISGILAPFLELPQFQIVAITTYAGLHQNIEQRPAILALFEKVEVSEISKRETLMLLENIALFLERKHKIFISYPALREIVELSEHYLSTSPFPEKAMGLLDEVAIYVSSIKEKIVLPKHVAKIITEKTQIPVGEIEMKEREILLNLENLIHRRIINQKEAVDEVATALRRARAKLTTKRGPMGCFLFLGPTGVGKTETSKALAEIYFGSETQMIRMDMSEFQDVKDIPRLIGSLEQPGLFTTQVKENPFSLILLDEIEKAHPNILNLFLQVLDEGFLTDGLGRKIIFKDTIIIATSNAGYQIILEALRQKTEWSEVKQKLLDYLFEKAIFRPEFINRFDAMVVFRPLSKKDLLSIAELIFQKLKQNLKEKNIEFVITEPLKEKIVELGYDPFFGARAMRRTIQDKVENVLAPALLSGELKRGDKVEIDPKEFKLKIK